MISLWSTLNDPESWLPLYIPLAFWVVAYSWCMLKGIEFYRYHRLHNVHNFPAIIMGMISLYLSDDEVFSERIPILWSVAYFSIELLDCVIRVDGAYFLHAALCLGLGVTNYRFPLSRQLRMNSKASLLDLSNPLMHLSRKTRKPLHFMLFAIIFTCCRILWLPVMMKQLLDAGLAGMHPVTVALVIFYGLNLFWYYKILRILFEGTEGKTAKKEH